MISKIIMIKFHQFKRMLHLLSKILFHIKIEKNFKLNQIITKN